MLHQSFGRISPIKGKKTKKKKKNSLSGGNCWKMHQNWIIYLQQRVLGSTRNHGVEDLKPGKNSVCAFHPKAPLVKILKSAHEYFCSGNSSSEQNSDRAHDKSEGEEDSSLSKHSTTSERFHEICMQKFCLGFVSFSFSEPCRFASNSRRFALPEKLRIWKKKKNYAGVHGWCMAGGDRALRARMMSCVCRAHCVVTGRLGREGHDGYGNDWRIIVTRLVECDG